MISQTDQKDESHFLRKRWRVHLFLMDIAWYSWLLSYLFLKISVSSSYFPWNYLKQHNESKFQIFDLLEGPTSIRSMNPALNFRVPPSRTCGWHCDHGDVSFRDSALWCRFLLWSKLGRNMWRVATLEIGDMKITRSLCWSRYAVESYLINHQPGQDPLWSCGFNPIWWFGTWILWLSIQLGISSSQLTNCIIFSEG